MPTTMTISLPDDMKSFIEQRTKAGSFASSSEFIRQLVREDQKRAERERLEGLLLEGLDSGQLVRATDEYWKDLRKRVEQRISKRGAAAGKTGKRR
ncbi:MAG: type II toxin-antitoxin system ParD family antitoxin [Tepidisphaerales bacterium]